MIVRLTHTARRASVSEADKRVAFSIAPTSASRNRSPSSSGFSPTPPLAPPIWKRHAGAEGFACPNCGVVGEPFRIATRPGVLTCRACRRQTGSTVGTVMERSHTPLSVWFWAAYLVASQTPGMSAVQFQRHLDLTRYETAFGILHKLRAGMPTRIGSAARRMGTSRWTKPMWVGKRAAKAFTTRRWWLPPSNIGSRAPHRTNGKATLVVSASPSLPTAAPVPWGIRRERRYAGDITDDWSGYGGLRKQGYDHHAIAECGDPEVAEEFMPIIHLVFSNLKTWLNGIHHGVSAKHLQADVVRNSGRVSSVTDIGDPAVPRIGSIFWVVRDSQRTQKELASIGHIAERQCDGSF